MKELLSKVKKKRLYLLPSGALIKVISFVDDDVIVVNYEEGINERYDMHTAERIFEPVYKISEAAKIVGRKSDTLRRYERSGKLPRAKKYKISSFADSAKIYEIRIYTSDDIKYLIDYFGSPGKKGSGKDEKIKQLERKIAERRVKK